MKYLLKSFILVMALLVLPSMALAEAEGVKRLPAPDKTGGKPLMSALAERHVTRKFSTEPLSDQMISDMLWAGFGINRPDGKRTAPTSKNVQDIEIYILLPDGVWLYEPKEHALQLINKQDARSMSIPAPAVLLYVADSEKSSNELTAAMHTGSIYQNVGLYCASAGLNNVVNTRFEPVAMGKLLNLRASKKIMIAQSVGRP